MTPPPAWTLLPEPRLERLAWPLLTPFASWPDPAGLRDPARLTASERPDPSRERVLLESGALLLAEELRPERSDQALGLDPDGHLHLRLGPVREPRGSASLERSPSRPTFAAVVRTGQPAARTLEQLRAQVLAAVSPLVRDELGPGGERLGAHPREPGAGLAVFDAERGGLAIQYPYLYAVSAPERLLLVWQELRHETLDPSAVQEPPGDGR